MRDDFVDRALHVAAHVHVARDALGLGIGFATDERDGLVVHVMPGRVASACDVDAQVRIGPIDTHRPYGAGRRSGKTPGPAGGRNATWRRCCDAASDARHASDDSHGRSVKAFDAARLLAARGFAADDVATPHGVRLPFSVCP
ncbi:hypothetical protein [Burkholderia sp. Bp8992]|uniref:hypothetical protein n=1 Tax=Burkholderia sp. Bp8992 TaxID=2184554 RepID=UPI000F584F89|nr:hypothetical protein [Burkholderia sp. Bp8992]